MKRTAVAMVVLLLAGACGGREEAGRTTRASSAPATQDPDATATPIIPGEPSTSRASRASRFDGSQTPGPPASGATSASIAPADPARPGTYAYATDGTIRVADGPPRQLPETTTLLIDPPNGREQHSTRDLRDEDGIGTIVEQTLVFADDGVHLRFFKLKSNLAGLSRTYTFDLKEIPLVVKTGAQPGDRSQFTMQGDGVTIETNRRSERDRRYRYQWEERARGGRRVRFDVERRAPGPPALGEPHRVG